MTITHVNIVGWLFIKRVTAEAVADLARVSKTMVIFALSNISKMRVREETDPKKDMDIGFMGTSRLSVLMIFLWWLIGIHR